ncbi:MAG: peroxiredoxin [Deltaproteobacteria bacterium]|nr:peroxiredoxin [Deltaproteobacteria bacterium]
MALKVGDPAPDFSAKNQDGKTIHLADFKGKQPVLLYFYPKDDTPGCTKEACSFRDRFAKFKELGAVVLGVSGQGAKSHQEFRAKHKLPFDLLVDSDGAINKAYDVGTMFVVGFYKRRSVLIGKDGKLLRYYEDVNPETHAAEVIKDLEDARGR